MRKLIILTAVTSILLIGGQQQAWAGNTTRYDDDNYGTFKKVVHVLDDLINDDRHKGKNHVYVWKYYRPRRVCYFKGPRKVCYLKRHSGHQCGQGCHYKK